MTDSSPAPLLQAVASYALSTTRLRPPSAPADAAPWQRFLAAAVEMHLTGFLVDAVARGTWPVTEVQKQETLDAHAEALAVCLLLERELLGVVSLLDRGGLEHRVLKGTAHAHLLYADPSLRTFGDVDILVRSDDFDAAGRMLADAGGRRRFPEPRPGFDRRFSKGASFVMPGGFEVDLHRTFVAGPFGLTMDPAALFQDGTSFRLGGRTLMALGPHHQFLNSCYHAALGGAIPRLLALRDVAQFIDGGDNADRAVDHARDWGAAVVVARAVSSAGTSLGLSSTPLTEWAEAYVPSRRERRRLHHYIGEHRSYAGQAITAVGAVRGTRNRAAYLAAILLPKQARRPALTRWRRGVEALVDRSLRP